jgi:hypothetical protein
LCKAIPPTTLSELPMASLFTRKLKIIMRLARESQAVRARAGQV